MTDHPKPPRCKRPDETTEDYRVAMGWDQADPHLKRAEPWGRLYSVAGRLAAYLGYHGTVEAKSNLGLLLVDALNAIDGSNYCPGLIPASDEPQWGPILDELDGLPNDLRPEFAKLDRLIRTEHERTLARLDATTPCGECHIRPGEECDICGKTQPTEQPHCPKCGTHEVSRQQTCHNSACEAYARDLTIYEGWNVQKSSRLAFDPCGAGEKPRKLGAEPSTRERHAEALRGLRNLKVLLGIDAPEVRGWAPAVQQAAQRAVNAAIRVLVENGNG